VHASPAEQRLLEEACAEARRAACLVVLFGPAAGRLAPLLDHTTLVVAGDLEHAVATAGERLSGAHTLLVSPMFPVSLPERTQIAPALRALVR
jgi:UDP-N-acetylmuramoylalanine-D-glutamate ligase